VRGYLLDENLPERLILPSSHPVHHARDLGASLTDSGLWAVARQERLVIVSKDADFAERIIISSPPPWVIHLRIGNMRLTEFRAFILKVWPQIEPLLSAHKLINLYRDRIEAISDL